MSNRPTSYKYYEMGLRPGDWMSILDTVQFKKEWAIVHDLSDNEYFKPRYEIWVNGEKVDEAKSLSEAKKLMQNYLQGLNEP